MVMCALDMEKQDVVFTNIAVTSAVTRRALAVKVIAILDACPTIDTWIRLTQPNFEEKKKNSENLFWAE